MQPESVEEEVAKEFIHTEETFLCRMRVLAKYQENLMRIISDEVEQIRVFGNLHAVINASGLLLERIHAMHGVIALAFISISRVIQRAFTEYCASHEVAVEIVQRYLKNSIEFKRIAEETQRDEEADGLDIISLLLEPIQRIARYPLLFRQMTQPQTAALKAQKESERILRLVNEGIRSEEHFRELEQIQTSINLNGTLDLTKPCKSGLPRKLIKQGSLRLLGSKKKKDQLQAFLFNDVLLILDINRNVLYEPFAIQELVAIEKAEGMELVTNAYGSIVFQGNCAEWVAAINKASECYIHLTPNLRSYRGVSLLFTAKVIINNIRFSLALPDTYWTASTSTGITSSTRDYIELGLVSREREKLLVTLFKSRKFEPDIIQAQFNLYPIVSGQHHLKSSCGIELFLECLVFDDKQD